VSNDLKKAALTAFRLALRPLFRILLRTGVTWREASEVCKTTLVEVATGDYGLHGRPTNMSRVAILTGLSRREVRRLRELLETESKPESEPVGGATRVLTGWHLDPDFRDESGQPLDLLFSRASDGGNGPTFTELCKRHGGDLAPITLRRELVRVGAVQELPGGGLRILKRYYMPLPMEPDAVVRGGSMLEDVGMTISFNLAKADGETSRFAGRATNARIRPSDARHFAVFLDKEGQAFLERVDEWLSEREAPPAAGDPPKTKTLRIGVGVYGIYDEPDS
jgi:hypothetical protein